MANDWKVNKREVNEVGFANHLFEFVKFYEAHQKICDELAGIKERRFYQGNQEKTKIINKETFLDGIKRLQSFIINYLHNIKDYDDLKRMKKDIHKIEYSFLNDHRYYELVNKNRSADEEIELTIKYLKYLIICFKLLNKMCNLLQTSLMIGTKDIKKSVMYYNDRQFFESLSNYRKEMSDDIAYFKMGAVIDHLKRILAYYYTYRLMMKKEEVEIIDYVIDLIVDYILDKKIIDFILKIKEKKTINKDLEREILEETTNIKNMLSAIYFSVNKSLSDRNILPKIQKKIFIDTSLI